MSFLGLQYPDAAPFFSGTVSTTGPSSAFNTTGYDSLVFQVSGSPWSGIITVEGSNDGNIWSPMLVTKLSELAIKTQIDINGNWLVKADTLYIRWNITNITGTVTLTLIGNNNVVSNPVDRLSLAMDSVNDTPLYVSLQPQNSGIQQDLNGGVILSDAPKVNQAYIPAGSSVVIDTTGYSSLQVTTQSFTGSVYASNDGVTYTSLYGASASSASSGNLPLGTLSNITSYIYPCSARYIRLTATTGGIVTWFLRQQPFQPFAGVGLNYINGTAPVTGGVAGVLGVGGPNTTGGATTTNPNQIGGVDSSNLVRRALTDTSGRLQTLAFSLNPTILSSNAQVVTTTTAGGALPPAALAGYNNNIPLSVGDTSQFEGQTQIEILALILQELKILNQQTYELPKIMAGMLNGYQTASYAPQPQYGDEPAQMRNDASLFFQQQ